MTIQPPKREFETKQKERQTKQKEDINKKNFNKIVLKNKDYKEASSKETKENWPIRFQFMPINAMSWAIVS